MGDRCCGTGSSAITWIVVLALLALGAYFFYTGGFGTRVEKPQVIESPTAPVQVTPANPSNR